MERVSHLNVDKATIDAIEFDGQARKSAPTFFKHITTEGQMISFNGKSLFLPKGSVLCSDGQSDVWIAKKEYFDKMYTIEPK